MNSENIKLVIYVPLTQADEIRRVLGDTGAGKVRDYDFCSFSSRGVGRFRGNKKSHPAVGKAGVYESVEEERIEVLVPRSILKEVVTKMKAVHPYEDVAYDIYPVESFDN